MKYLFDNCLSFRHANMLAALDIDVTALRDVFSPDIKDRDFLPRLVAGEWVLITTDRHMQTRQIEAAALKASGVTALFLGRFYAKMGFWDQAKWLVTHWQAITGFAESVTPGAIAVIQQNGTIRFL